jgi:hypothetical protein
LLARFREVRRGRVKIEDGIETIRLLYKIFKEVRCVKFEKNREIDPLN